MPGTHPTPQVTAPETGGAPQALGDLGRDTGPGRQPQNACGSHPHPPVTHLSLLLCRVLASDPPARLEAVGGASGPTSRGAAGGGSRLAAATQSRPAWLSDKASLPPRVPIRPGTCTQRLSLVSLLHKRCFPSRAGPRPQGAKVGPEPQSEAPPSERHDLLSTWRAHPHQGPRCLQEASDPKAPLFLL